MPAPKRLIFITGAEGSVTTLLRRLLAAPAQCASLGFNRIGLALVGLTQPVQPVTRRRMANGSIKIDSELVTEGRISPVTAEISVTRIDGKAVAFQRGCPHEGADLAGGYVTDGLIICPWHGLRIEGATGRSGCRTIKPLGMINCTEDNGVIAFQLPKFPKRTQIGNSSQPKQKLLTIELAKRVVRRGRRVARTMLRR